ncbi:lipase 2 [Pyricularia oryzae 70-15]|uniref:Carboxylic ester hydrolase n=3 Tax=Pyricularia oryzae TaxID=318829 RepID=G4MNS9_PYRO7|nr:lipase 2 [Pyricularia oryzae 70-15]EHA56295.1 lipase 2 [Pyricularia oryzae 70-15]ELQ41306.1 lipase 2 [Pyricularia oryzae Y34]KAI7911974.1 lipase 2 [Pyricularia oryzae]KAI7922464.1 lipase 2 [Pyricularia oryzae]
MRQSIFQSLMLAAGASAAVLPRASQGPTVQVANGSYYGVHNSFYDQDLFLGMPYAQPPVGNLRFRVPEPLNSTWDGVRNATEYGYACIGYGSDQWVLGNYVNEDCLTVNVVRPAGVPANAKLPVAVWIHGGGYFMGSGSDPRYNTSFLVKESVEMGTPMVAVTLNYRLSAWGFIFGKEVQAAGQTNIGMRDQRLALHWIQENIDAFGGDKSKVTIFGESAGGNSVGTQLIAYGGRDDGLFRAAISQSGAPSGLGRMTTPESWQPAYDALVSKAGCADAADSLDCLRGVPADALNAFINSTDVLAGPARPVIDGDLLTEVGTTSLRAGRFVHVPYLIGANADEGVSFGVRGINTEDEFVAMVQRSNAGLTRDDALAIAALYPDDPDQGIPSTLKGRPGPDLQPLLGSMWKRSAAYGGDPIMHAPRRIANEEWARHGVPSYSYHFDVLTNGIPDYAGSTHFQEVAFMFNNTGGLGYGNAVSVNPFGGMPESLKSLSHMMARMWISFVVNLDPNHIGIDKPAEWPVYTLEQPQNYVFDVNATGYGYIEPDTYRAEGIKYISDRFETVFRQ